MIELMVDKKQAERLINILKNKKFKVAALCRTAALESNIPVREAMCGKSELSKDDIAALIKVVSKVHKDANDVLFALSRKGRLSHVTITLIYNLLHRKEVIWYRVFKNHKPLW